VNKSTNPIRIAILDMYQQVYNQGMASINQCLVLVQSEMGIEFNIQIFAVRSNGEMPGMDFDLYISTGGPGSPMESTESWENEYKQWLNALLKHNQLAEPSEKKFGFFICHSFQLVCRMLQVGELSHRLQKSEGIFPVERTEEGAKDPVFQYLSNPFWVLDSREYQVTNLNQEKVNELGGTLLAIEQANASEATHQAIMSMRFNDEMMGTQFHPEADADGLVRYLENRIKTDHDQAAVWKSGLEQAIIHSDAIQQTHHTILPEFLKQAIRQIR
jgi:GMP synthase-like glutamine amidotransferase